MRARAHTPSIFRCAAVAVPPRREGGDEEEGVALTTEAVHVVFLTREGMRRRTTQRIHVHVCLMYLVYVERSSGEQEQEPVRENGMR